MLILSLRSLAHAPTRYLSPDASAAALELAEPELLPLGEGAFMLLFSSSCSFLEAFLLRILLVLFFPERVRRVLNSPSHFAFCFSPRNSFFSTRSFAQHGRGKAQWNRLFLSSSVAL